MKQLFYLMLISASIFILSCNKETLGITATTENIQTTKLSENSVSIDEAKTAFFKASKEITSSVVVGTPLNIADFDPQWSQTNSVNYVDTSGNALTVPTTVFQHGGYKKLTFFRANGQTTFLVSTVVGTPEYLIRKKGVCTMNDFCGYIYYTKPDGTPAGGYKLDNGAIAAFLIPKTGPRPEWTFWDQLLGDYTVTATSTGGGGIIPIYINTGSFSNYKNLLNNFSIDLNNSGSGSSNNSSLNGSAPPPINSNLCRTSFVVTDNTANGTKDMGLKNVDLSMTDPNGLPLSIGFQGLSFRIPNQDVSTNRFITNDTARAIATRSFNSAQIALQNIINNPNTPVTRLTQPALKNAFLQSLNLNIDDNVGLALSNPHTGHVTWELTVIFSAAQMTYSDPITGVCP